LRRLSLRLRGLCLIRGFWLTVTRSVTKRGPNRFGRGLRLPAHVIGHRSIDRLVAHQLFQKHHLRGPSLAEATPHVKAPVLHNLDLPAVLIDRLGSHLQVDFLPILVIVFPFVSAVIRWVNRFT